MRIDYFTIKEQELDKIINPDVPKLQDVKNYFKRTYHQISHNDAKRVLNEVYHRMIRGKDFLESIEDIAENTIIFGKNAVIFPIFYEDLKYEYTEGFMIEAKKRNLYFTD